MGIGIGIFGNFSGKVGNVVGRQRKGKQVLAAYQPKVNDKQSPAQISRRKIFTATNKMMFALLALVNEAFTPSKPGRTALNEAMAANKGVLGVDNHDVIVFETDCGVFSRGNLEKPSITMQATATGNDIRVDYDPTAYANGNANDKAILVIVFSQDCGIAVFKELGKRTDGTLALTVPPTFPHGDYRCSLLFKNETTGVYSDSVYAGIANIQ